MARRRSLPTIADVAREAGVSISTVSRILNKSPLVADDTLEKVHEAIQRLGYLPHSAARNLALRHTNTLGLLIESVGSHFFAEVLEGAEEAAREQNFSVLIATLQHILRGDRPTLGPSNTDGLMILGIQLKKKQFSFYQESYPIICLYQPAPRALNIPLISIENKEGAFRVVEHLIREHKLCRIAFLRGPKGNYDSRQREVGYRQAMRKYGLPIDEDLFGYGGFAFPRARESVLLWVQQGCLPQAIFTGNDDAALDVVMTLNGLGLRVPQDVAVVGFDDSVMSSNLTPPLTTVRAPSKEVGREAARQLIHLIETGEAEPLTRLPTELVIRNSCGCQPVSQTNLAVDRLATVESIANGISH